MENRMELVTWVDSASSDGGWAWQDDWVVKYSTILSMGFIVHEDDVSVTVMAHLADKAPISGKRQGKGGIVIPKVCITNRQVLGHKEQS